VWGRHPGLRGRQPRLLRPSGSAAGPRRRIARRRRGRHVRRRPGARAWFRPRDHDRPLAPVRRARDRRRLDRMSRGGAVLHPLRKDRGHRRRARSGPRRRDHRPHWRVGRARGRAALCDGAGPDEPVRGERGNTRRHHRGQAPGPPSCYRGAARRLVLPELRPWPRRAPADASPRRDPGGGAPLRRGRIEATFRHR
jgi:hypothetical protein